MSKIDDWLAQGIQFRPEHVVTDHPVRRLVNRAYKVLVTRSEEPVASVPEPKLSPNARMVLDEVEATLHLSQSWYIQHEEEDGTHVMYAADVINRLRQIYGLPI